MQGYIQKILENQYDETTYRNWDYLPAKAYNQYSINREDKIIVLGGTSQIVDEEKHNLTLSFKIKNGTKGDKIELPYLYYLGYNIKLKSENQNYELVSEESENGFI